MSLYFFKSGRDDDDDDEVAGQLICKLPLHDLYTQLPWLYNLNGNFYEDDFSKKKFFAFIKIIVDQNQNDGVERIMCEHRIWRWKRKKFK